MKPITIHQREFKLERDAEDDVVACASCDQVTVTYNDQGYRSCPFCLFTEGKPYNTMTKKMMAQMFNTLLEAVKG